MKLRKSVLIVTLVAVLAVAFASFAAPTRVSAKAKACDNSIVDVALAVNAQTGEFSTLIAALSSANLVRKFDQCGSVSLTVFAPTDAAFAKLGLNASNIGSAFPKKTLTNILLYHVALRSLYAEDVVERDSIRMANRGFVGVDVNDMGVFLTSNNTPAKIITVDVAADNGVIHIIDTVLLP